MIGTFIDYPYGVQFAASTTGRTDGKNGVGCQARIRP
jgi:hypothetical protein